MSRSGRLAAPTASAVAPGANRLSPVLASNNATIECVRLSTNPLAFLPLSTLYPDFNYYR